MLVPVGLLSLMLVAGPADKPGQSPPPGMVWVPAGEFTMGWDGPEGRFDEQPAHRVSVDGFWIDVTEVTNRQFRAFVDATGYVTTAERVPDWEEMKKQVDIQHQSRTTTPTPPIPVAVEVQTRMTRKI